MKRACLPLLVLFLACSSSSGPPSVYNTWLYTSTDGTSALGVTFKTDGTYVSQVLQLTSATSGNDQVESGTFTARGSTLTFTPTKWSCPEPTDPPYTATYQQSGDTLSIAYSSGVVVYVVDTAGASSFAIATGCFPKSGGFVATPLEPIGQCTAAGSACTSATTCCLGSVCVSAGGGVCAGTCTMDSDCQSGCCAAPGSIQCPGSDSYINDCGYCAPPSACGVVDAGTTSNGDAGQSTGGEAGEAGSYDASVGGGG